MIGCSAALSGCEEKHGQAMLRAVELAVEEANELDLPQKIKLIWDDDAGDTEQGIEVAKKFIANPKILGVVGPMNSNPSIGAAPLYDQAGLVHITNSASNVRLSEKGYRTFFRMIANDYVQADALVNFTVKYLKAKQVSVINDDTDFSTGLAELVLERMKKAGIQITNHISLTCGKNDYSAELAPLNTSAPEVIFFAVLEPEGKLVSRLLRERGNRSVFLGTDALKPSKFLVTPGYDVAGPYHSCASADITREPEASRFADAFELKHGEKYSIYTAEAYDAAKILIQSIEKFQEPTRDLVLGNVAKTTNYQGASGVKSFTENGELKNPRISFYYYKEGLLEFIGFSDQIL
jgi:branched-chain amino acid transport system substrate-binding protein